ncbi:DUF742 domain-containing protein [Streptomyces sp. DW26H14]|uniref:DUF742 domain-containing protein n=1 Tax=Streptomyces sp. DW26H14 TaxID=3435395 RepID=UPI00403DE0DB
MTDPQERTVPAIRPYVITGGRADAGGPELPWESLVVAAGPGRQGQAGALQPEHRDILEHCQGLISVGEIAAHLGQPLPVVRVLLADLLGWGLIATRPPIRRAEQSDVSMLKRILDGLEQEL